MSELAEAYYINLVGNIFDLRDLKGIEFFTNLQRLEVRNATIETVDLRACKSLESVICTDSGIVNLYVAGDNLTKVVCRGNNIVSLDVSKCPNLTWLDCEQNPLTTLKLPKNSVLNRLACGYTELGSFSTKGLKELEMLFAGKLTWVDVTDSRKLREIHVTKETEVIGASDSVAVLRSPYH